MANGITLKVGHWYKFKDTYGDGSQHIGQYMGNTQEFECCICGKGHKAHEFNIWYDPEGGYETWAYGREHLPKLIEDLGDQEQEIMDEA